jgi:hypothetical protein
MTADDPSRVAIRNVTLLASLLAYAFLGASLASRTFRAATNTTPPVNGVQAAAFGALAVALGGGYAVLLGVAPQQPAAGARAAANPVGWVIRQLTSPGFTKTLLIGGAFLYLAVGIAACVAYGIKDSHTPTVVRTVAIGFGGYVIAYIGSAYQKFA